MATEKRDKPDGRAYTPRKTIPLSVNSEDTEEIGRTYAKHFTSSAFAALRVITAADKSAGYERDMDVPTLMATLGEQGEAVNAGNLAEAEAMLMNQATALQTLSARLVERGMGCTDITAFEINLRMGLRAQAQCRATLETLAAIKNPAPVAFVRQANIAHGPQQVNNPSVPQGETPRAQENENPQNKLSEDHNELLPDPGASTLARGIDPQMEALGEIDRAEIRRR